MKDNNKILEVDEIINIIELDDDERCFFANNILTHNSGYDSTEITMNSIAESAGLSHTADMMYAIIQDSMMYNSDPPEYWLKILKIRDGEGKNMRFKLTINYDYMRLSESNDGWGGFQQDDVDGSQ
jgi:hypothetical protein